MREAIGSAFLVNLILVFIGVISALLIGSINFSKSFKVKDRIVYIIEKYDGMTKDAQDPAKLEIDKSLSSIGYTVIDGFSSRCEGLMKKRYGSDYNSENLIHGANVGAGQYDYCVYKNSKGDYTYYSVVAFMRFDVPLVGNMLVFPVSGETSPIFEPVDN